jgi:hypothetical protein
MCGAGDGAEVPHADMETVARGGGHRSAESHDGIIVEPLRKMRGTTAMPDDLAPRGFYEGLTARSLMAGGRHLGGGAAHGVSRSPRMSCRRSACMQSSYLLAMRWPCRCGTDTFRTALTDEPIVAEFGLLHHVDG